MFNYFKNYFLINKIFTCAINAQNETFRNLSGNGNVKEFMVYSMCVIIYKTLRVNVSQLLLYHQKEGNWKSVTS